MKCNICNSEIECNHRELILSTGKVIIDEWDWCPFCNHMVKGSSKIV